MTKVSERTVPKREVLLVGPYGVLGTGVLDAAAADPSWRVTTAARRPPPTYRPDTAYRHLGVDLMDREGTIKAFSELDSVTDLVFAAYIEKPTMAETIEPNARMLTNTLDALAARNVPLQRIVLAGGAKSYGFSLGAFNAPAKETEPRLIAPIHYHRQEDITAAWSEKNGASWDSPTSSSRDGAELKFSDEPCDESCHLRRDEPRIGRPAEIPWATGRMEYPSGDHRRSALRARNIVGPERREREERSLQCLEWRCLPLASAVECLGRVL
jgi:hypothetical protein